MKSYKIRKRISIAALSILLVFVLAKSSMSVMKCEGPTTLVRVTVKQIAISPPTYVYTITNLYQSPIVDFILGRGDQREMLITPDNIPTAVESPQGWDGQYIFVEESEYMHIFWLAKDKQFVIAPNTSLSGFKLVMPKPMERKVPLYGPSGEIDAPLDMKKAPFDVRFNDSTCVWGRVVAE